MIEFNNHRLGIFESVARKVTLSDENGLRLFEGVMLSPELTHESKIESIRQITILRRFSLDESEGLLYFENGLYGESELEHSVKMTATRAIDKRENEFVLTPIDSSAVVFAE